VRRRADGFRAYTEDPSRLDAVHPPRNALRHLRRRNRPQERGGAGERRILVHLTPDLLRRVMRAVYWTPGLELSALAARALERGVTELEGERGGAFPPIPREKLRRGGRGSSVDLKV